MKIAIIVNNKNEETEVVVPIDLWRRVGIFVQVISAEKKKNVILQTGMKIVCDDILDKENLSKYDAIYFPGGAGSKSLLNPNYIKLQNFLTKAKKDKKIYFLAICAAPTTLAKMGLMNDVKATCYPSLKKEIPHFVDEKVVLDKKIITSQGPGTVFEFALKVIQKLLGNSAVKELAKDILY